MKEQYFELYCIVNSTGAKIVRLLLFFVSIVFLFLQLRNALDLKLPLAIFALILINELFIEHLKKIKPQSKVLKDSQNPKNSIVFSARQDFEKAKDSFSLVHEIKNNASVKFFREKLGLGKIEASDISKEELLKQALEDAIWVEGEYITEVDLFASYVLLSEESTRFLQSNNLNKDDVVSILYWTRRKFGPDKFEESHIKLTSEGAFDTLIYGWNFELKKYSKNLTLEVLSRHFPPTTTCAEKQYKELEIGLSKHKSSNVIIVGEPGTGKTTLVEYLALASFIGDVSKEISHKKIYELLVDRLISGVTNAGELEERLSQMLSEIIHSGNSIVFIRAIENIFGGGGFDFDMSGILGEYLNSDKIKIIGTTTPQGFANFIQRKPNVAALFEKVELPEPSDNKTLLLLTEKAEEIESKYKLKIKYQALKQSVILSPIFFPDRFSPGRAIELLSDTASKAQIENKKIIDGKDVIELVQSKTNVALEAPDEAEKELLVHLENKLHARVVGQSDAVSAVASALRRLRSGFKDEKRPISVLLFLGPTGVGKTETAKALAAEYFGNEKSMIRLDMSEYQTQDQLKRLLGQNPSEEFIPNTLSDLVGKQPFSLILLDEFEKAHPHILDIFLQVFDEGRLTDNRGKMVSFKNAIIIATSNAGSELLRERQNAGVSIKKPELIDYLLKNNLFKPELINRFDEVVVFHFLNEGEIKRIAQILLAESLKSLQDDQIKVIFDAQVVEKITKEAYDPTFGARNIRRYIESNIEDFLSKQILEDKIKKGDQVMLSVDSSGNFVVS